MHRDANIPKSFSLSIKKKKNATLFLSLSLCLHCIPLSLSIYTSLSLLLVPYHLQKSAPSFVSLFLSVQARGAELCRTCLPMLMEVDWDLHAVVRGCTTISSVSSSSSNPTTASAASSVTSNCFDLIYQPAASSALSTTFSVGQACKISCLPDPIEARNSSEELHELYKPFFPKSQSFTSPSSTLSYFSYTTAPKVAQVQQKQQQQPSKQPGAGHRSKRRKNQLKKVFQVPAEALSSDIWAWRKYGQKPIKGSPYPRGYYRCSSSKGCLARKQVEQNRSEPGMFIVTYTAEHNHPAPTHRNSLAGSTRQKPLTSEAVTASEPDGKSQAKPTSPVTPKVEEEVVPHSTSSESKEEKEDLVDDEEDEFGIHQMELTDDFFTGLDEFTSSAATSDCFADHIPASLGLLSWGTNCPTVSAGSGCLPAKDQMSSCLPYQS